LKETYKTPDASTLENHNQHKVNAMFTAQRLLEQLKEDPEGDFIKKYDLSSLKTQF
jgi:propionyl-CoA synthetase